MKKVAVFGHKNPDSDSVLSAIILGEFLSGRGEDAVPFTLGKINLESEFVLKKFGVKEPKVLSSVEEINDFSVAIVDTTNPMQLPNGIERNDIKMIVDHHNLGGLVTAGVPEIWVRPYGATCTVLYEMFSLARIKASKTILSLILSGILSDTFNLTAATTVEQDKNAVREISRELGCDVDSLWEELLDAKSNISGLTDMDLILLDSKEFVFHNKLFFIANIDVKYPDAIMARLQDIKKTLLEMKTKYYCVMSIINIMSTNKSILISFADDNEKIAKIFDKKFENNETLFDRILVRKKDIVALLQSSDILD
ncbi:MAG: DHH family phosphoesterase [Christensenellaceae bacterium]|jgi:manganese-dependent inorganic pyrophosphatase|nr:DHH family phosphoesterase [Christensenellaceae bacterium]